MMNKIASTPTVVILLVLLGIASTSLVTPRFLRGDTESTPEVRDCGSKSLYLILRLEGWIGELKDLQGHLPRISENGHSMLDLRNAASACGLKLVAKKLPVGGEISDRPALVFLDQGQHGHFVVIRPVGHSGKLDQIIDPNGPSEVIDINEMHAMSEWTGLALIPAGRGRMPHMV